MVTIQKLIEKNDRDISLFQGYIASLAGKSGTRQYVGDLTRRIAAARQSNLILRAAR